MTVTEFRHLTALLPPDAFVLTDGASNTHVGEMRFIDRSRNPTLWPGAAAYAVLLGAERDEYPLTLAAIAQLLEHVAGGCMLRLANRNGGELRAVRRIMNVPDHGDELPRIKLSSTGYGRPPAAANATEYTSLAG